VCVCVCVCVCVVNYLEILKQMLEQKMYKPMKEH
jgi:hypothetical protein